MYKFVPQFPFTGSFVITNPAQSPFTSGQLFGLKVGSNGDNGQGTEIGQGVWVEIDASAFRDPSGNIVLRQAQAALKLTGTIALKIWTSIRWSTRPARSGSAGPTPAA